MRVINGYKLLDELSTQNAGFSRWGFCEKEGREYFIKEFLTPVYPADNLELSREIIARKRQVCEAFCKAKIEFYRVLNRCRTGNNILIHEFFRSGSKYYIVTDKIDAAGTDPALISRLSGEKKETVIRAILYSIAMLHASGIVHADLKPDNILLKKTNEGFFTAKIIDFDTGFLIGKTLTEAHGDFIYLAPETYLKMNNGQIALTEKIDIFALGILFHQYWTGELPQIGADYRYTFEAVLDENVVQLNDAIPLDFQRIIRRMLSLNPVLRPSAGEVLNLFRSKDERITPDRLNPPLVPPTGFYVPKDL